MATPTGWEGPMAEQTVEEGPMGAWARSEGLISERTGPKGPGVS